MVSFLVFKNINRKKYFCMATKRPRQISSWPIMRQFNFEIHSWKTIDIEKCLNGED